ncbi:hypothetical protein [Moorena sp. SIO4G3]|uniref:hypothetical protein n=1 Tax=Moorena sp. SIO4G3 TaxID=2607821 RepID=UPI00142AF718|nr:hypothetical protein [Moorena sp. SIO4G3]NEO77966.1 hypothetical protein [Moorena sp. SIO4G3]
MADIKINDIKPAGADLFADDESFIKELSNDELNIVGGGKDGQISSLFSKNCCNQDEAMKKDMMQ